MPVSCLDEMEVPELSFKECASVYVRDEFYESIQAPKFYDFCSFEEEPSDVDAFFRKSGGAIKTSRQFEGTCLEPNLIKVKQDVILPKAADHLQGCQSGSTALIPDESTLERASVCGSKKVRSTVLKSQDKVSVKSKVFKKAKIPCNAPIPPSALERSSNDSCVQQPSAAKSHPPSENEDPNPASRVQRKTTTRAGSKFKTESSISSSAFAASQSVFERKATSDSRALEVQILRSRRKEDVEIADSSSTKQNSASQDGNSGAKDRKRKPSGRNVDGLVSKGLEPNPLCTIRVSKVSRKVSVSVETTEICFSDAKEAAATVSSRSSSQSKDAVASETMRASTKPVIAAVLKRTTAARKVRRNSDQNRRRKASTIVNNTRRGTQQSPPSANKAEVVTQTNAPGEEGMHFMSSCSSNDDFTRDSGLVDSSMVEMASEGTEQMASAVNYEVSVEKSTMDTNEVEGNLANQANCNDLESRDGVLPHVRQNVPLLQQLHFNSSQFPHEKSSSVAESLLEQLQNLHLKQGSVLPLSAERGEEAQKRDGELNNSNNQLLPAHNGATKREISKEAVHKRGGSRDESEELICGDNSSRFKVADSNHEQKLQAPEERQINYGLALGNGATTLDDTCELNSSRLKTENATEQGGSSLVSEDRQGDRGARSEEVLKVHGYKAISSGLKLADDLDQFTLLNKFQSLRLPRGEESYPSDRMPVLELQKDFSVCSQSEDVVGLTVATPLSSSSNGSHEARANSAKESVSEDVLFSRKAEECLASSGEGGNSEGERHTHPCILKQNKKRKSIEIVSQKLDLEVPVLAGLSVDVPDMTKVALQSAVVSPLPPSTARNAPLVAAGQHKKMKTTCPQPFRLRTQERGALKEVEFNKKVEQYLVAAKEKPPFVLSAANKETKGALKTIKTPKEPKGSARPLQVSEMRAAAVQHAEAEVKKMRKNMVPQSQKMPCFDKPFKPHRSTKAPTVPNSPNFQHKTKKLPAIVRGEE